MQYISETNNIDKTRQDFAKGSIMIISMED